jgi:hypothetical protein
MCAAALVLAGSFAAGDDKAAVREIPTKELKVVPPKGGKATAPTEVKSAEELARNEALKGAAEAIKKQVNFDKEKLVFFAWAGSGQDRVTPDETAPGTFTHTRGLTRDLRRHVRLFAVPKDAAVKVVPGK